MSVKFQLKLSHRSFLYHFENADFVWKQKHAVFVHVSLNANELPRPFSRIGLCLYSSNLRWSAKKYILIIMSVVLKSCIKSHNSLNFCAQKAAVIQHVSTKLSSLSCLIALKQSNTHKFMLITWIRYKNTVGYVCESKQPERNRMFILDLCIKWQQRNIQYCCLCC